MRTWRLQQTRPRILPGSGDIVLLADATWRLTAWDAVKEARERGAKIGSVVYDLIPITHGELAGEALRLAFIRWLTAAQEHSDFFDDFSSNDGCSSRVSGFEWLAPKTNTLFPPRLVDGIRARWYHSRLHPQTI